MQVSRRQFFKICAGGMAGTTAAALGFAPSVALAETRQYKLLRTRETRNTCTYCSVGCGVCGVEQLNDIGKPVQPLPFTQTFDLNKLDDALRHLNDFQPVGQLTGCTHAAAWMLPSGELVGGHEDVGRHVALDKLLGRRSQEGESWQQGAVLVSSRASYEMVQKSAMCGVEILFAVSAATTLAVEVAERCNLTLVGFCKPGRATVYTHPQRLSN